MLTAKIIIEHEEGWRDRPYYCSEGYPTIGYGFKLAGKDAPLPDFTLPRPAGDAWLDSLVREIRFQLGPRLSGINECRQAVLVSMAYQMGISGLLGFRKMWAAAAARDFDAAAVEMLDSRWARQTPARAKRHASVIRSGSSAGVYP